MYWFTIICNFKFCIKIFCFCFLLFKLYLYLYLHVYNFLRTRNTLSGRHRCFGPGSGWPGLEQCNFSSRWALFFFGRKGPTGKTSNKINHNSHNNHKLQTGNPLLLTKNSVPASTDGRIFFPIFALAVAESRATTTTTNGN